MTEYLWRYAFREGSANVEVGVFDADRWRTAPTPKERGGILFGITADVYVNRTGWPEPVYDVSVNQGSMSVNIENALLKHDVYGQAIAVAKAITEYLASGVELQDIARYLDLPHLDTPTSRRFGDD